MHFTRAKITGKRENIRLSSRISNRKAQDGISEVQVNSKFKRESVTYQTMLTKDTRFIRRRKDGSKLLNSSLKSIPLGVCQLKPCKYQASLRISHVVQTADKIFMLKCQQ